MSSKENQQNQESGIICQERNGQQKDTTRDRKQQNIGGITRNKTQQGPCLQNNENPDKKTMLAGNPKRPHRNDSTKQNDGKTKPHDEPHGWHLQSGEPTKNPTKKVLQNLGH